MDGGQGFSLATKNVTLRYFNTLIVWFSLYLYFGVFTLQFEISVTGLKYVVMWVIYMYVGLNKKKERVKDIKPIYILG